MPDDWKGAHLISAKTSNNRREATRLVNVIWHATRRKEGTPAPAARKHKALVSSALQDVETRGGKT